MQGLRAADSYLPGQAGSPTTGQGETKLENMMRLQDDPLLSLMSSFRSTDKNLCGCLSDAPTAQHVYKKAGTPTNATLGLSQQSGTRIIGNRSCFLFSRPEFPLRVSLVRKNSTLEVIIDGGALS